MSNQVYQDWTTSQVLLKFDRHRDVKYKVYGHDGKLYQEIRDLDDAPIHTLELPERMALETSSYEVLLRYVLLDVIGSTAS